MQVGPNAITKLLHLGDSYWNRVLPRAGTSLPAPMHCGSWSPMQDGSISSLVEMEQVGLAPQTRAGLAELRRHPRSSAVVAIGLALRITTNTVVFSAGRAIVVTEAFAGAELAGGGEQNLVGVIGQFDCVRRAGRRRSQPLGWGGSGLAGRSRRTTCSSTRMASSKMNRLGKPPYRAAGSLLGAPSS